MTEGSRWGYELGTHAHRLVVLVSSRKAPPKFSSCHSLLFFLVLPGSWWYVGFVLWDWMGAWEPRTESSGWSWCYIGWGRGSVALLFSFLVQCVRDWLLWICLVWEERAERRRAKLGRYCLSTIKKHVLVVLIDDDKQSILFIRGLSPNQCLCRDGKREGSISVWYVTGVECRSNLRCGQILAYFILRLFHDLCLLHSCGCWRVMTRAQFGVNLEDE